MRERALSNAEHEALFGFWLMGALMIIRGVTLVLTPDSSIQNSDMYSTMDAIVPFVMWGGLFVLGGLIVIGSSVSQTVRKYYGLLIGNGLGLLVGIPFTLISFIQSHMSVTQYTVSLVAFLNLVLVVYSGVSIWKERKRIHMLRKLN